MNISGNNWGQGITGVRNNWGQSKLKCCSPIYEESFYFKASKTNKKWKFKFTLTPRFTLAAYIDRKSKGIESTILSSGFHATRQPTAPQKEQFYIIDGDNTGCVHLFSKPTPRAGAYIWQMYKGSIPLNEADWITIGHTTRADLEVSGLEATAIYYFRNCAITPDGKTDYCAPVKKIVI